MRFPIAREGVDIIKEFEKGPPRWRGTPKMSPGGAALVAYKCPAGVWTIGWGHTSGVTAKSTLRDERQAEALLAGDLMTKKNEVLNACSVRPNDNQVAAMACLAFNIGAGAFAGSSVVKAHNRGDFQAAARAFNLWVKARVDGKLKQMDGLVSRRAREMALYLKATRERDKVPLPQAVAPEPRQLTGDIGPAVATAGAGTVAGAAEAIRQVGDVSYSVGPIVDLIKYAPFIVLGVGLTAGIGWWLWRRHKQRQQGWL